MIPTIFALATPPGRGAIAVVRISGGETARLVEAMAGALPAPRRASLRRLSDPVTSATLDRAVVVWMPAPESYTGEDVAELHLHGGVAVVEAVSSALLAAGAWPAEPGEFTRRAFENQRLDLLEVEAVADLIEAQSEAQRRQAVAQLEGSLRSLAFGWRSRLLSAMAFLEAAVDFPDEELPDAVAARCVPELQAVLSALTEVSLDIRGERVRAGFEVAVLGPPNAGKSSLFNALLGRDAAIVSPQPGTTRDVIESSVVVGGRLIRLIDTAGLRETTDDPIEREGMRRASERATSADLRLWLQPEDQVEPSIVSPPDGQSKTDWVILSKCDVAPAKAGCAAFRVSSMTGEGLDALSAAIGARAAADDAAEPAILTRARHRRLFKAAADHVERGLTSLSRGDSPELAAEDVRMAARNLEGLAGRIDSEAVLGRIFAEFCIGK